MGQAGGTSAQQIMDAFGLTKPMVKSSLARLVRLDRKFYKISGMEGRAVSGSPKIKKTGLHLSTTLLKNYGFKEGDEFRFSVREEGEIVLEKV